MQTHIAISTIIKEFFMIQGSKYIGQGYVIDYLLQFYLKDKFKSVTSLSSQDNTSKLNFVIENENGAKLGVHVTINTDDSKAAAFIKRKVDMLLLADKALYLHINLSLHENEKLEENQLITNILENAYVVIKNSFNDIDDAVAYQVSPYGMQKQDLNKIMTFISEYRHNLLDQKNKSINELDGDPLEASIIRIKGKLIVVELMSGSTHIGVVDYDAVNKDAIIEEIRNAETNMYGRLENYIRVLAKMEPNKEPGRPDMARIIALR